VSHTQNYIKPKSYNDLIERLKDIEGQTTQIQGITDYFLNCVEYDYDTFEGLRTQEIYDEMEKFDFSDPVERQNGLELLREKERKIDPMHIACIEEMCQFLDSKNSTESAYNFRYLSACIPTAQHDEKTGLLKKGLCKDFTNEVIKIAGELGILAGKVLGYICFATNAGETEVGHFWNIFSPDDSEESHYDITLAIFVRDNYKGINRVSDINDWLLVPYSELSKPGIGRKSFERIFWSNKSMQSVER